MYATSLSHYVLTLSLQSQPEVAQAAQDDPVRFAELLRQTRQRQNEAEYARQREIERLNAQRNVLDSLTAKAELTNNTAEMRILRKSEQSLQREIKRKEMQRQQYVVQESDNSLYGRATVFIQSIMVGTEEDVLECSDDEQGDGDEGGAAEGQAFHD